MVMKWYPSWDPYRMQWQNNTTLSRRWSEEARNTRWKQYTHLEGVEPAGWIRAMCAKLFCVHGCQVRTRWLSKSYTRVLPLLATWKQLAHLGSVSPLCCCLFTSLSSQPHIEVYMWLENANLSGLSLVSFHVSCLFAGPALPPLRS